MMPQPEEPPQAGKREGDEDGRSMVRAVVRDRPASPAPDPIPMDQALVARGSRDRQATSARRGPVGFRYRDAMRIVRPVSEIEDDARSLFDSCDEEKGAARE